MHPEPAGDGDKLENTKENVKYFVFEVPPFDSLLRPDSFYFASTYQHWKSVSAQIIILLLTSLAFATNGKL